VKSGSRTPLTEETLAVAVRQLAARDIDLGGIVARFGAPPLWDRPSGFPTLVHIILEQQVSLASASAAFARLRARVDPLTPAGFLALTDTDLLAIGFSRQKARYARALASAVEDATLDIDGLAALDDEAVERELVALPGIGPWTATIYRLMVLRRPDAWPASDIALAQSLAEVQGLPGRPSPQEMLAIAETWRPWRAVAARILWHGYLGTRAERRTAAPLSAASAVQPPWPRCHGPARVHVRLRIGSGSRRTGVRSRPRSPHRRTMRTTGRAGRSRRGCGR